MNIPNVRIIVATGAAFLVMGLGGNLSATPYTLSDRSDFGTGPPWSLGRVDVKAGFLSGDHGMSGWLANLAFLDRSRRDVAREARERKHFGRSDRSERRVKTPQSHTTRPARVDTPTNVPDSASTMFLLGGTLCGLFVMRRKAQV